MSLGHDSQRRAIIRPGSRGAFRCALRGEKFSALNGTWTAAPVFGDCFVPIVTGGKAALPPVALPLQ